MKTHKRLAAMLREAQRERRCVIGGDEAIQQACRRRLAAGELVSPYRNTYIDSVYWNGLNAEERSLHLIATLA